MISIFRHARFLKLLFGGLVFFSVQIAGAGQFQISDGAEFNKIIDTNTAVLTTNATLSLPGRQPRARRADMDSWKPRLSDL